MDPLLVREWYETARDATREWRESARECYDMVAGRQWNDSEISQMKEGRRIPIVLNRVAPYVDAIVGQQVNNRKEVRFLPRETSDARIADMYTEAVRWADDLCDGEDEVTESFTDMVICGLGWTETRMDYSTDPAGQLITAERIDPLEMYWDPHDDSRNLDHSKYIIRAKRFDKTEAERRWPKIKDVADWTSSDNDLDDQIFQHDAQNAWKYENDYGAFNPTTRQYLVLQCQYYKDEDAYRVMDPQDGNLLTLPAARVDKMKSDLDAWGIRYVKTTVRKWFTCFVCGDQLLEKIDGPSEKGFTLRCMTGKRDRNKRSWHGVVKALIDPQKYSNKFFSDMSYILSTNRKGGAFVETDALADPRRAEDQWSSPDALIKLNPGGIQKIRERDAGIFPAGLDRLYQFAVDAVPNVSGISPELVGQADRNQPGILEGMRKQSSLTILAPLFDSLKRHQRERGRIVLDFLHRFIADGRILRVTSPEGQTQAMPLMPAADASTYDIIVDEMPTTPNSKQETFAVLAQLVPFMAKVGIMPPPEVLEYLPLPATLVEKWRGMLTQSQEKVDPQQQLEAAKMQAAQAELQAKLQLQQMQQQADMQRAQVENATAEQAAQLKQREMEMNLALKSQEAQLKAAELELKRAELALEAQQTAEQLQQTQTDNKALQSQFEGVLSQMVQAMAQLGDAQQQAAQAANAQVSAIATSLAAPRKVIRDGEGRPIGTEIDSTQLRERDDGGDAMKALLEALTAPREVVRDERGRAVGTRIVK